MSTKLIQTKDYLLLIDEEAEIKFNDLMYDSKLEIVIRHNSYNDGCSKIIAYYPLTEAKEFDLPELPNPFEIDFNIPILQEELNKRTKESNTCDLNEFGNGLIRGFKAAQSKQIELLKRAIQLASDAENIEEVEREIIQSLSTQQLPKEFVPEYETVQTTKKEDYKYENGNSNLNYIQKLKTINNILQGYYIW